MDPSTQDPTQPGTFDPLGASTQTQTQDVSTQAPEQWIAYHNTTIIGFYGSEADANDAISGYRMSTVIDINDVLDTVQIVLPSVV